MSNLTPHNPNNSPKTLTSSPLNKPAGTSLAARMHAAKQQSAQNEKKANTMPNRIVLMEDCSGSMSGENIINLRKAVESFIRNCDFNETSLCHRPFGLYDQDSKSFFDKPLSCDINLLLYPLHKLEADGGTPLGQCMEDTINAVPLTRGIIVSDGSPEDKKQCYEAATNLYKEADVPLDCVHISESTSGEQCLRKIAEITGGLYIKFTDVSQFSQAFHFLTPANYSMLMLASPEDQQRILGSNK